MRKKVGLYKLNLIFNKRFNDIKKIMQEIFEKYPCVMFLVDDIRVLYSKKLKEEAFVCTSWEQRGSRYILKCSIRLNNRYLKNYDFASLKGIIWHEIGHILSTYCYLDYDNFSINSKGQITVSDIFFKEMSQKYYSEPQYRCELVSNFWEQCFLQRESDDLGIFFDNMLTKNNCSEMFAECFKYVYTNREKKHSESDYSYEFILMRKIVEVFDKNYIDKYNKLK